MILTLVVALVVVVAVAIAFMARPSRRPASDAVAVRLPEADFPEPELPQPEPEPAITWTVALTATDLDETARLRLIDDLTLLASPWTVALLRRAHQEESSPQLRARIEAALASSGEPVRTPS